MVILAKHEAALAALNSADPQERTRAVRFIKNNVIGNRVKKELYLGLGVAARLVELLSDPTSNVELRAQVAVVLGSFAYGNDRNVKMLVEAEAIEPLLKSLSTGDLKLTEAGARALKAIFQSPEAPNELVFESTYLEDLIQLLVPLKESFPCHSPELHAPVRVAEVAAGILAKVCVTSDDQKKIAASGAIPLLLALLTPEWNQLYPKVQEAALDALANLCRGSKQIAQNIVESMVPGSLCPALYYMSNLIRDQRPVMRLLAATCMTRIYRTGKMPANRSQEAYITILPTLIKLFSDTAPISTLYGSGWATVQEKAPRVFADLVEASEDLQRAALEADAISRLAAVIIAQNPGGMANGKEADDGKTGKTKPKKEQKRKLSAPAESPPAAPARKTASCGHAERVLEAALKAIAAVCSLKEECRKQVIDAKLLPHIVKAMSHPNHRVRCAACDCTRSLSRSVKNLRTSLVDAGVGLPIFKLLYDESEKVQLTASATLCNIVMDFSPMKKTVLDNGGVERLIELARSMDGHLRLNAVWALKNLLYQADSDIKEKVMKGLEWDSLMCLIADPEVAIQEQALNLLRNLACGKEADIEQVFQGLGERRLLDILETKLSQFPANEDLVLQGLYVIVNISTGNDRHKAAIMGRDLLLRSILRFMTSSSSNIRLATVWCVINLTWTDDAGASDRTERLRQLGFVPILESMADDLNMDVKDRVKTALASFGSSQLPGSYPSTATGTHPAILDPHSSMMDISGGVAGSGIPVHVPTGVAATSARNRREWERISDRGSEGGSSAGGGTSVLGNLNQG
ncbi:armadillo-type protein [Fimicolochytrium jonesii]|uniref:armadillo-type protein n=1 Tax=Fimicolochytrium jonesii TaxID=1396493 RepID=UPI0022FE3786|nr:armadillo-type protein [Fimicolochytrium jonesii]KAI8822623.1 armadillo-type protein [Fimicolochytrium jonesii]